MPLSAVMKSVVARRCRGRVEVDDIVLAVPRCGGAHVAVAQSRPLAGSICAVTARSLLGTLMSLGIGRLCSDWLRLRLASRE